MLKKIVKKLIPLPFFEIISLYKRTRPLAKRTCPICNYVGYFNNFGSPPRLDAECKVCGSLERHRLFWLWYRNHKEEIKTPILHFAPEQIIQQKFQGIYKNEYKTADLYAPTDYQINIENINLDNQTVKTIICNHVLEHVDDKKALLELKRILCDDGKMFVSVPIIEGWSETYENGQITSSIERTIHFGQWDHFRLYGANFRKKLTDAGFSYSEITAEGEDVIQYGLWRGEKFFICRKD